MPKGIEEFRFRTSQSSCSNTIEILVIESLNALASNTAFFSETPLSFRLIKHMLKNY